MAFKTIRGSTVDVEYSEKHRKIEAARHKKRLQIVEAHTCYIAVHAAEAIFLTITKEQAMTLLKHYGDYFEAKSVMNKDRNLCALIFDVNIVSWEDIFEHLEDCGFSK